MAFITLVMSELQKWNHKKLKVLFFIYIAFQVSACFFRLIWVEFFSFASFLLTCSAFSHSSNARKWFFISCVFSLTFHKQVLSEAIEFRSSFSVLNQALWKIENGHLFFETYSYFACNLWGKRKILLRIVPLYGDCVFAQVNIF